MRYGLGVAIAIVLLALLGQTQSWLPGLSRWSYDLQVRLSATGAVPAHDVAIIKIDDPSLHEVGRWPWPRDVQAQLIETLHQHYQVKLIGLDIVMAEPESNPLQPLWPALCADLARSDEHTCPRWQTQLGALLQPEARLIQTLEQTPVIGGMYFLPEPSKSGLLPAAIQLADPRQSKLFAPALGYGGNWQGLAKGLKNAGFLNTVVDPDGVVRRVPLLIRYQDWLYPSLAAQMAAHLTAADQATIEPVVLSDASGFQALDGIVLGKKLVTRIDPLGRVLLPQFGPAGTIAAFSAADVLQHRVRVGELQGRAVIIGATAPGLLDIRATPLSPTYPGLEAQASLLQGILSDRLSWAPPWAALAVLPMMILIGAFLVWRFRQDGFLRCHIWFIAISVGCLGLSYVLWVLHRWVLPIVWLLIMILGLYLWMVLAARFLAFRQHRLLRARFGEYIPPQIVAKLDSATLEQGMSPEIRPMTVLFADLKEFTAIAEQLNPEELAELLNAYLGAMTEQIHAQQGVVDKYIGDAIMAFWGAPVSDDLQQQHAINTALAMQQCLVALNAQFSLRGWPTLAMGIAIHCGPMRVGNMGSHYRRAYTVMGDAVNVASRTEALTRLYHQAILVTEDMVAAAPEYQWLEIDYVRVKGRQQPLGIYTLAPAGFEAWRETWLLMRAACRNGDAQTAMTLLTLCRALGLEDELYQSYATRLPVWPVEGVWNWSSK